MASPQDSKLEHTSADSDDMHVARNSSKISIEGQPTQNLSSEKRTPTNRELAERRKNATRGSTKTKLSASGEAAATSTAGSPQEAVETLTNRELAERKKNAFVEKKNKKEQVTRQIKQSDDDDEFKANKSGDQSLSSLKKTEREGAAPGVFDFDSGTGVGNSEAFESTDLHREESDHSQEYPDTASPIAAHTVDDEVEAMVVGVGDDEVELHNEEEYERKSRRRRLCIRLGAVAIFLVVGVIAAVVGVSVSSSPAEVLATPAPTVSPAPTQASSSIPSSPPTASPTVSPSTATPTSGPGECFQAYDELVAAVDRYVQDNGPDTEVAATYGWPIGVWCTEFITSLEDVFSGFRNPAMGDFNEYIGGWDVSRVINMKGTFEAALVFDQDIGGWDVSRVVTFENCFNGAVSFDQPLDDWDVSSATTFFSSSSAPFALARPFLRT